MDTEAVVKTVGEKAKLNAKERRLLAYLYDGGDPNVGAACRQLHTTPFTLLSKTLPNLRAKLKDVGINFG